jgi:hypothetical protein
MFGLKRYNYGTFTRDLILKDLAKTKFAGGPKPGERAPEFEARTLDGDTIELSDYRGEKNVVLTFGSATCPMTAAAMDGLNELYDEFHGDDVEFVFCYVREAHPGDDLPAHRTMDEKIAAAELLRESRNCWSASRSAGPSTRWCTAAKTTAFHCAMRCCTLIGQCRAAGIARWKITSRRWACRDV